MPARPGPLGSRNREICETRVRYGYRRVDVLLRREGWHVNQERTRRICNELGLQLRTKTPKRRVKPGALLHRSDQGGQYTSQHFQELSRTRRPYDLQRSDGWLGGEGNPDRALSLGAAVVLDIWGIHVGPILPGLGLVRVAVALGAQDLFKNLIAGIFIIG